MTCLSCVYAAFTAPADWTPGYPGETYGKYDVMKAINRTGSAQRIYCTLNPVWQEFNTNHYCGKWCSESESVNLRQTETRLRNYYSTLNMRDAQIKELKAQLKKAREISAGRLSRLKATPQTERATANGAGGSPHE
jgi:hypothetical protein